MTQEQWNNRYLNQDTPWETGHYHLEMARLFTNYINPKQRVCEIGCGVGTNALWLKQAGYDVTAIDVSAEAIRQAEQKADHHQLSINFLTLDFLTHSELLGTFPVIFDCMVLQVFIDKTDRKRFVNNATMLCEDKGYWINLSCSKDESHAISSATGIKSPPALSVYEIAELIEPTFEIIEMHRFPFLIDRKNGKATFNAWGSIFKKR